MSGTRARLVDAIVHTSVHDGLLSATCAGVPTIRRAIKEESKRAKPRTALINGLERELRRRARQKGKS